VKKALVIPLLAVAGVALGGGTAFGVQRLFPPPAKTARPKIVPAFVPTGKLLAPLVSAEGRLAGYMTFELELQTEDNDVDYVTKRLPLLLDAVNMRTFRTPMASGPDEVLPDLAVLRKLVLEAAASVYGPKVVHRVVVMQAAPT
jgi:hypothetical protein